MQHAWKSKVIDETSRTGQQRDIFEAGNRSPNKLLVQDKAIAWRSGQRPVSVTALHHPIRASRYRNASKRGEKRASLWERFHHCKTTSRLARARRPKTHARM
jgi:hypothetical protein